MNASNISYLMEGPEESLRLDIKTDAEAVRKQALWCGLKPGMRVLDAGCGSGKVSSILYEMIQPGGEVIAIDFSKSRIDHAESKYGRKPFLKFMLHDLRELTAEIGDFDRIWCRFLLEHYLKGSFSLVKNLGSFLKPDGFLCLIDLDNNALNHYEMPTQMYKTLLYLMSILEEKYNFDPYIGRKLYSYLYDLDYREISVDLMPHHLLYGKFRENDFFNWHKKIETIASKEIVAESGYPGGWKTFLNDFFEFLNSERRFTYTPLIMCKGKKAL